MARMPRQLDTDKEGRLHLRGQVAGPAEYYPLQKAENAAQLLAILQHFTGLFFCQVVSLSILGNHYHLVCVFEAFRELSREELWRLAELFYPDARYRPYLRWKAKDWERFNRRLFNPSELMRNVNGGYATWFNRRYGRKGRFWAGRFQSTESDNLVETALYVDLNPVRAKLVKRPERWRYSSAWMRQHGQDEWLMPLEAWMGPSGKPKEAERGYWARLYWRGTKPSKENDGVIPVELARQMEAEQFGRGCYLKSIPGYSRGRVVGSKAFVERGLDRYRAEGLYKRRKNPVPLGVGGLYMLREQRSNFIPI